MSCWMCLIGVKTTSSLREGLFTNSITQYFNLLIFRSFYRETAKVLESSDMTALV